MKGLMGNFGEINIFTMENFSRYYKISPELSLVLSKPVSALTTSDLPPIYARINEINEFINNNNSIIAKENDYKALEAKKNNIIDRLNAIARELNLVILINQEKFRVGFPHLGPSDLENYFIESIKTQNFISEDPKITSLSTPTTAEEILKRKIELNVLNHVLIKELNLLDLQLLLKLIEEAKRSNIRLSQERDNLIRLKNSINENIKPDVPQLIEQKSAIPIVTEVTNKILEVPAPKKKKNYWWLLVVAGVGTYLYTKE